MHNGCSVFVVCISSQSEQNANFNSTLNAELISVVGCKILLDATCDATHIFKHEHNR